MELLTNRLAQYTRSVTASKSWVIRTEENLDDLAGLFTEAYERSVRINNAAFSDSDREAEAQNLEAILENMVDVMNGRDGEEYIFAGTRTTVRPFVQDAGPPPTVTYDGNAGTRDRYIGRDLSMRINIEGQRLHDTGAGYTITDAVQGLIDGVRAGDPAAIETSIEEISVARDHVIDLGGEAGALANRLDLAETQLRDASHLAETRRSEMEDLDFAAAMTDFQKTQIALQAAVQVTSSVLNTTLLDYLR